MLQVTLHLQAESGEKWKLVFGLFAHFILSGILTHRKMLPTVATNLLTSVNLV